MAKGQRFDRLFDTITHFLARLEMRDMFFWNPDRFATFRITSYAGRAVICTKASKTTNFNAIAVSKAVPMESSINLTEISVSFVVRLRKRSARAAMRSARVMSCILSNGEKLGKLFDCSIVRANCKRFGP